MILWRLTPARYAAQALAGNGAALRGGRWNSRGILAVYASLDPATTILETLTTFDPEDAPEGGFQLLRLELPNDAAAREPSISDLPAGWNRPEKTPEVQSYGDAFLRAAKHLLLIVPSAALSEARNAVINPLHPQASKLKIAHSRAFAFDPRWPLKR